mgnify:FL=1|tara:strand:+ start:2324 stop:3229 length:906 start_codon:yes stop_codon:yes gene_type:complete
MQKFESLGIIFKPPKKNSWSKTHCMLPTIFKFSNNKIRIFFGSRNKNNISSIGFVDLYYKKKKFEIIKYSSKPVLKPGLLGTFDDNGVLPSSIIKKDKLFYLFYIGWRPNVTTRYSLIAGLSKSKNLNSFKRVSRSPILKLSNKEPFQILTAPTVLKKKKVYYMWYVSCNKWKNKDLPYYDIKFATSKNLIEWNQTGISCIKLKKGERAVARPFVIYEKNLFKMWYCYEKKTNGYKIGYGESLDGKKWTRKDNKIHFINTFRGENKMRAYPNLIRLNGDTLIFYNGNNYGEEGIFCSKLQK